MALAGRGADQFPVRLPDGMRDEIKATAKMNGRSMNSEILARLQGPQTLRDWFAGQAVVGLIASPRLPKSLQEVNADHCAEFAYEVADAMLIIREKSVGKA